MPEVSVILPTRNRKQFLREAVQSVLDQTYQDWELLVIDDGSPEGENAFIQQYNDCRILYFRQKPMGRSKARNNGLLHASGNFIAFLDDDDLFMPDKLEKELQCFHENLNVDFVASGVHVCDDHLENIEVWLPWTVQSEISAFQMFFHCQMIPSSVLFRRTLLDQMDHWFDPELPPCEDTDFFIRALLTGCKTEYVKSLLTRYRLHRQPSIDDVHQCCLKHHLMLDKLFHSQSLPQDVIRQKTSIYFHYHLVSLCRYYTVLDENRAQHHLLHAMQLNPRHIETKLPSLLAHFAGLGNADPRIYLEYVYSHLSKTVEQANQILMTAYQIFLQKWKKRQHNLQMHSRMECKESRCQK